MNRNYDSGNDMFPFIWIMWFIIIMLLLMSCNPDNPNNPMSRANIGWGDGSGDDVQIIKYEGCEYVFFPYGNASWGSHKGNCSNPIHRNSNLSVDGTKYSIDSVVMLKDDIKFYKDGKLFNMTMK